MKNYILIAILPAASLLLTSCNFGCDDVCRTIELESAKAEIQMNVERVKTEQEQIRHQNEVNALIEKNKTPEQRQLEMQIKLENEKLEMQRKTLEANESQAQSLKYLEDSRQVHDTIEMV
jgi:hypothetical protein